MGGAGWGSVSEQAARVSVGVDSPMHARRSQPLGGLAAPPPPLPVCSSGGCRLGLALPSLPPAHWLTDMCSLPLPLPPPLPSGAACPLCAAAGGVIGQEVVKAVSGKFHPIFQVLAEGFPPYAPTLTTPLPGSARCACMPHIARSTWLLLPRPIANICYGAGHPLMDARPQAVRPG